MTKYYFLINCFLWALCGHSQDCVWTNLLEVPGKWSGDIGRFMTLSDGWQLNDFQADNASVTFYAETPVQVLQFTFTLDFPPSDKNKFKMTIGLQNAEGTDSAIVVLSIGETGDEDGVQMSYYSDGQLVREESFWKGTYGAGVERASWILETGNTGMTIRQGADDQDHLIRWEEQKEMNLVISSITLGCVYTKTRSSHFIFHHLYSNVETGYMVTNLTPGDLFISEYRYTEKTSRNFIELYNAFSEPTCLAGLRIKVNEVNMEVPPLRIEPGSYILLVDSTFDLISDPAIKSVPLDFAFVSSGKPDGIRLFNFDHLIHVVYPSEQDDAGTSMEMVDILQPCRTDNWKQSMTAEGTPGMENSWFYSLDSAKMTYQWKNTQTGILTYPYIQLDYEDVTQYITANHPFELEVKKERSTFELRFEETFLPKDSVIIKVKGDFPGCGGEIITWDTSFVEYPPHKGRERGLLFTELMYDPPASCPEYLEITNMESLTIGWDQLLIQNGNGRPVPLDLPFDWYSGESRVITTDKARFLECYEEARSGSVYFAPLFALNNSGATLSLLAADPSVRIIDQVSYSPSSHNMLFSDPKGVALERNFLEPENNKWRSGFVQFGYRSPGFLPVWDLMSEVEIVFSASTIYPRDGYFPSALEVEIGSSGVGGSVTIEIFDLQGRQVRTLADAVPVQGGEIFIWKGTGETGLILPEGLYLFWIYYFDVEGRKRIFKKTCVLSNK